MNPCNFCGNAVVYHLDGGRNACPKCGNGTPEREREEEFRRACDATMTTTDINELFK